MQVYIAVVAVAAVMTSSYMADAVCTSQTCTTTVGSSCTMEAFATQPYPLSPGQKLVMESCINSGGNCICDPCSAYFEQNTCSADTTCFWTPRGGCVATGKMCVRFSSNASECNTYKMCKHDGSVCVFTTPAAPTATLTDCPPMHPFAVAMIILIFMTLVAMAVIIGVMIVLRNKARAEEERNEEERDAEAAIQASKRPASLPNAHRASQSISPTQATSHYSGYAAPPSATQNAASADDLDIDAGGGEEEAAAEDAGGYYDEEGNWIATDGSYDPNAYGYDENGNYVGGDGADQGGYYDEEGNWVATEGGAYEAVEDDEDF